MSKLSDIGKIKEILTENGFTFSKSMGQNFLINPSVCPKMAEFSTADDKTGVLEVGPGIGVLTTELASIAKKVVAIELDKRLPAILEKTLSEHKNVTVISGDVLKINIEKILKEEFSDCERIVVCANLPYYITSPVIMMFLEGRFPISAITVMVQKEAAIRLCAEPGTRESGAVTLAVNYYSEPKMLFNVSRGSFMPAPNVDSAVIRLDIRQEPAVQVKDEKMLFSVIKAGFGQRRKTLLNSLASGLSLSKDVVADAIKKSNLAPNIRAENLTIEDFGLISDFLC